MKINKNLIFSFFIIAIAILSCKKESVELPDIDKIKKGNNALVKLDSTQALTGITKQKLQELYDISALYISGDKNTALDSLNYKQIQGYFYTKDSNNVKNLFNELDSLKVRYAKIKDVELSTEIVSGDTLDFAKYIVEYKKSNQKPIGEFNKKSLFKMIKKTTKIKNEFKFYFVKIDVPEKDSTSVGVTK